MEKLYIFSRENPLKLKDWISCGLIEKAVDGMRQQLSPNPNSQMP
jgi:hypothetical protein